MCTYDYTPYVGCKEGEQHFYLQWMKCSKVAESGNRYCPVETSVEVDALRKLSGNVLSCPIHSPIAIQQFEFDFIQAPFISEADQQRARSRSKARRSSTISKAKSPKIGAQVPDSVDRARSRRRSTRDVSPTGSINSQSSEAYPARPRTSDGTKRRSSMAGERPSHRRISSADMDLLPKRATTMRQVKTEAALPSAVETSEQADVEAPEEETRGRSRRPAAATVSVPTGGSPAIGLPASPDIIRRSSVSVHRAKSEGRIRASGETMIDTSVPPSTYFSSPDTSPEHQSEPLPFSSPPTHRGRRSTRSIRKSTEESPMKRIDEHVGQGEEFADGGLNIQIPPTRSSTRRSSRSSRVISPQSSTSDSGLPPLPRDAAYRISASPRVASPRHGSFRHEPPPMSPLSPTFSFTRNDDAASVTSSRSRRATNNLHTVPRTAAATTDILAHMSEPHLPLAGRESLDSGYRSGHQRQKSTSEASRPPASTDLPLDGGRELLLRKQGLGAPYLTNIGMPNRPPPLQLGNLPPCALPVSLYSPAAPGQESPVKGNGGKMPLLHRIGLRKKISGLWEKSPIAREAGAVEG